MVKILRLLGFIVSLIIQNYTTANGKIHHHKFVVSTSLSLSLSLYSSLLLLFISCLIQLLLQVKSASFTRLCNTKEILTVNGKFPGPTLEAYTGDELIVTVYNRAKYNITLHWYVLPCLRTKIQTVFLQKLV
jgi:laccase